MLIYEVKKSRQDKSGTASLEPTITKLRNKGVLRSTKDGLILESSLEEYLYSQ